MTDDQAPDIVEIQVKKYPARISLEDILAPLAQSAQTTMQGSGGQPIHPDAAPHLQKFVDLAQELTSVVRQINQIDPTILAPRQDPQPPST